MDEVGVVTLAADLRPEVADSEIGRAVGTRHRIASKYVTRLRRRHPDATPTDIVAMLERHYITAITVAGGVVTIGTIAANVGLALIPGVAASKEAGKGVAKVAAKSAGKATASAVARKAASSAARSAARSGAERAVQMLPAGDEQLQFEITAVFALALAEVHDLDFDDDQAHALVYGLCNGRVSPSQIAAMASDVARVSPHAVGSTIVNGRTDWTHWANTLADTLPGGAARDLVRTVETGELEDVRATLNGKQQSVIEYGVGALAGGATRFLFGGEVVRAARQAFADVPQEFPARLSDEAVARSDDDREPHRAVAALEDAARSTGTWVSDAARRSTQPFRRIDLDGDGVPDDPKALTAAREMGSAVSGAVSAGTRPFRRVDLDGDGVPDEPSALTALKRSRSSAAARVRRRGARPEGGDPSGPDDA